MPKSEVLGIGTSWLGNSSCLPFAFHRVLHAAHPLCSMLIPFLLRYRRVANDKKYAADQRNEGREGGREGDIVCIASFNSTPRGM